MVRCYVAVDLQGAVGPKSVLVTYLVLPGDVPLVGSSGKSMSTCVAGPVLLD